MGHLGLRNLALIVSKAIAKVKKSLSKAGLAMILVPETELFILEHE